MQPDPAPNEAAEAAKGSKRATRALKLFGQNEVVSVTSNRMLADIGSLWWGRLAHLQLVERPAHMESGAWVWTLTPLGLAIRAILQNESTPDAEV